MEAIVKTVSNFKNANGRKLKVVELKGDRVSCKVPFYGFNRKGEPQGNEVTADFKIREIVEFC
jgi:hypothetical protein